MIQSVLVWNRNKIGAPPQSLPPAFPASTRMKLREISHLSPDRHETEPPVTVLSANRHRVASAAAPEPPSETAV